MKSLCLGRSILQIVIILMLFTAVGCVSKTQHQELIDNYKNLSVKKDNLEKSCEINAEQLEGQIKALEEESAVLSSKNLELAIVNESQAEKLNNDFVDMQELVSSLEQQLVGEETRVSLLEESLKIEVIDKLFFKSGSATVTRSGSKILAKIAPILLSAVDNDIIIVGHTDELPPSKKLASLYPSNWELSAARAASIVHILTWNYKIKPTRMVIQGAAQYHQPDLVNPANKSSRKNKRVVEIILKPKGN